MWQTTTTTALARAAARARRARAAAAATLPGIRTPHFRSPRAHARRRLLADRAGASCRRWVWRRCCTLPRRTSSATSGTTPTALRRRTWRLPTRRALIVPSALVCFLFSFLFFCFSRVFALPNSCFLFFFFHSFFKIFSFLSKNQFLLLFLSLSFQCF